MSVCRANACEIVAWRFLARQSERDAVDYCLYEISGKDAIDANPVVPTPFGNISEEADELSPLLPNPTGVALGLRSASRRAEMKHIIPKLTLSSATVLEDPRTGGQDRTGVLKDLNALEIAVIANAKRFLSQYIVQKIITGLWHGEIVFWDEVSANATKKPRYYNARTADPYSRLRVPKYLKAWEVAFFVAFLILYYSVVLERSHTKIPVVEVVFYVWLLAFAWDEVLEWGDSGIFYLADFWNIFDMIMISIGIVFAVLRIIGISLGNADISDTAFDVLSLEALLVIPRICSFLSLSPYWGTLIPCLKEMGKDFVKFMILVIIIYIGFLTTFSLMARDRFSIGVITWDITKIFYGNSGIGFDIMNEIDPNFGPPLMILFVTLSSILLMGSLTGMLSNSFGRVMAQAREEYLYFYSVYVLEASTSSRLTHFYPPFNLVALIFFRPWQIIFSKDDRFRHGRIIALKATHFPFVVIIAAYEWIWRRITDYKEHSDWETFSGKRGRSASEAQPPRPRPIAQRGRGGGKSGHWRRASDQLSPDARPGIRPPSAQGHSWSADDGEVEDHGSVSNGELLRRIDKLTELVLAMQSERLKG